MVNKVVSFSLKALLIQVREIKKWIVKIHNRDWLNMLEYCFNWILLWFLDITEALIHTSQTIEKPYLPKV